MDHQKQIALQRVDNLHGGISRANDMLDTVLCMLENENNTHEEIRKHVEETQEFLMWLTRI